MYACCVHMLRFVVLHEFRVSFSFWSSLAWGERFTGIEDDQKRTRDSDYTSTITWMYNFLSTPHPRKHPHPSPPHPFPPQMPRGAAWAIASWVTYDSKTENRTLLQGYHGLMKNSGAANESLLLILDQRAAAADQGKWQGTAQPTPAGWPRGMRATGDFGLAWPRLINLLNHSGYYRRISVGAAYTYV